MGDFEATGALLGRSPETCSRGWRGQLIGADVAEQRGGFAHPGKGRELIDRGDQEAGQAAVDLLVHGKHRQRPPLVERARAHETELLLGLRGSGFAAVDLQPIGIPRWQKVKPFRLKGAIAPGTGFDRNRPVALTRLPFGEHRMGGLLVAVAWTAKLVGCGGLAHPHADLEGPLAKLVWVSFLRPLKPFELQGADQGGGAAQLIQGEQAQGITHQHRDPGRFNPWAPQAAVNQGEGRQTEIGLRFATAGGEEQQLHGLPIQPAIGRICSRQARQVHQHKRQLEEAPVGIAAARGGADLSWRHLGGKGTALALGPGHHQVHGAEGFSHQGIGEQLDPVFDALGAVFCLGP